MIEAFGAFDMDTVIGKYPTRAQEMPIMLTLTTMCDTQKVFIYNFVIDFDEILELDPLKHYECIIDVKTDNLLKTLKGYPSIKEETTTKVHVCTTTDRLLNLKPTRSMIKKEELREFLYSIVTYLEAILSA